MSKHLVLPQAVPTTPDKSEWQKMAEPFRHYKKHEVFFELIKLYRKKIPKDKEGDLERIDSNLELVSQLTKNESAMSRLAADDDIVFLRQHFFVYFDIMLNPHYDFRYNDIESNDRFTQEVIEEINLQFGSIHVALFVLLSDYRSKIQEIIKTTYELTKKLTESIDDNEAIMNYAGDLREASDNLLEVVSQEKKMFALLNVTVNHLDRMAKKYHPVAYEFKEIERALGQKKESEALAEKVRKVKKVAEKIIKPPEILDEEKLTTAQALFMASSIAQIKSELKLQLPSDLQLDKLEWIRLVSIKVVLAKFEKAINAIKSRSFQSEMYGPACDILRAISENWETKAPQEFIIIFTSIITPIQEQQLRKIPELNDILKSCEEFIFDELCDKIKKDGTFDQSAYSHLHKKLKLPQNRHPTFQDTEAYLQDYFGSEKKSKELLDKLKEMPEYFALSLCCRCPASYQSLEEVKVVAVTKQPSQLELFQRFWTGKDSMTLNKSTPNQIQYAVHWIGELIAGIKCQHPSPKIDSTAFESDHYWIQVFFPTKAKSKVNPDIGAILLSDDLLKWFKEDEKAKKNFKQVLIAVLDLYGLLLRYDEDGNPTITAIEQEDSCYFRSSVFYEPYDEDFFSNKFHNYCRMTRIIDSCWQLGFEKEATGIYDQLSDLNTTRRLNIPKKTLDFWGIACQRPPECLSKKRFYLLDAPSSENPPSINSEAASGLQTKDSDANPALPLSNPSNTKVTALEQPDLINKQPSREVP